MVNSVHVNGARLGRNIHTSDLLEVVTSGSDSVPCSSLYKGADGGPVTFCGPCLRSWCTGLTPGSKLEELYLNNLREGKICGDYVFIFRAVDYELIGNSANIKWGPLEVVPITSTFHCIHCRQASQKLSSLRQSGENTLPPREINKQVNKSINSRLNLWD